MSDEYTNLDLDTADELLVQAGHPAIAKALRHQTQGNRNLIQGEWGMKVVSAFENILQAKVVDVLASVQVRLDQQIELVGQVLTEVREAKKTAKEALAVAKEARQETKKVQGQLKESQADRQGIHAEIADLKDAITRIESYLEPGMTPEVARERMAKYIAMIENHEEILRGLSGDASG